MLVVLSVCDMLVEIDVVVGKRDMVVNFFGWLGCGEDVKV